MAERFDDDRDRHRANAVEAHAADEPKACLHDDSSILGNALFSTMPPAEAVGDMSAADTYNSPQPELDQPNRYPIDRLPGRIQQLIMAGARKADAPVALAGNSLLAAASARFQLSTDVLMPVSQEVKPISLICLSVAESGERKSAVVAPYIEPFERFQDELDEAFKQERKQWLKAQADHKKCKDGPEPPDEPVYPGLLLDDVTIQIITSALGSGQSHAFLMLTEGGTFLGGHSMQAEQLKSTVSLLSLLWDGKSTRRRRMTNKETSIIKHARFTVHLMGPFATVADFLANPVARHQGILSRVLIVCPASRIGQRLSLQNEHADEDQLVLDRWSIATLSDLRRDWAIYESRRQNPAMPQREWAVRKTLFFDPEADSVMRKFYENVEKAQAPGGAFVDVTGFASKALEHASRLATIMCRIEYPDRNDIPYEIAFAATLLTNYYINETKRVLHLDGAPREERDDADLFNFIAEQAGSAVTSRDIARRGPQRLRQARRFRSVVNRLVDGGFIEETKHSKQGGKQLATAWRVVGDR